MSLLSVISPAKSLDLASNTPDFEGLPRFPKETKALASKLRNSSQKKIAELMSISKDLASLNAQRYKNFSEEYTADNSRAAIYTFNGDVYQGLDIQTLDSNAQEYVHHQTRILSGLYGLLRPLDAMQPYRLEMGTRLEIRKSKNLYQYWDQKITNLLNDDIKELGATTLVNLASQEYFKAIKKAKLNIPVLNIHFKEYRGDALKVISFSAKRARGMMLRYMAQHQVNDIEDLKGFNLDNYRFDSDHSDDSNWTFTR